MKKFLRSTAIVSALVLALSGCSENGGADRQVRSIYGSADVQNSVSHAAAPLAQDAKQSQRQENANNAPTIGEPVPPADSEPSDISEYYILADNVPEDAPLQWETSPKDYIPDEAYEVETAMRKIVETARTVEILEEKIAEFNADNEYAENYTVTEVTVSYDGETVSSGLLKNGMTVRVVFGSGGFTEYAVIRAPKDCIPDGTYEVETAMHKIVETARTVEMLVEKIAEFNADNEYAENYTVTEVTVSYDGETVTSGLLKNGMTVRVAFGSGGFTEYAVIRPPKDCIPDDIVKRY